VQTSYTKQPPSARHPNWSYNHFMRRLLAILLLCLFGLPMASQLFAATADQDAGLPACCRRNGTHHCSRTQHQSSQETQVTALRETCPAYPAATTSIRHNEVSFLEASPVFAGNPVSSTEVLLSVTLPKAVLDQSRRERGPPSFHS
jgi:hypothetical protein